MSKKVGKKSSETEDILVSFKTLVRPRDNGNRDRSNKSATKSAKETREELDNKDKDQNIKLKRYTLYGLFSFLVIETFLVFWFSYSQATMQVTIPFVDSNFFYLEEWSFKLLITATISQITYMLNIAVKHLFPAKE